MNEYEYRVMEPGFGKPREASDSKLAKGMPKDVAVALTVWLSWKYPSAGPYWVERRIVCDNEWEPVDESVE